MHGIGDIGTVTKGLHKYLEEISGEHSMDSLKATASASSIRLPDMMRR